MRKHADDESNQSEGGSFICIVCRSRKSYDVHLLEGKKCIEEDFVRKFIKLITKNVFKTLCENLKSHNDKNYVCRSCFSLILKTHDNISRLQKGVNKSIRKRMKAEYPSLVTGEDDKILDEPIEIRRCKKSSMQSIRKEELGKQGISSLKLVRINNIYPKIILKRSAYPHESENRESEDFVSDPMDNPGLSSLLVEKSCKAENTVITNSHQNTYMSELGGSNGKPNRNVGFQTLINAVNIVEADENSLHETSHNHTSKGYKLEKTDESTIKRKPNRLTKPGPLCWKIKFNLPILPDNSDERDPAKVKNLIIKTPMVMV